MVNRLLRPAYTNLCNTTANHSLTITPEITNAPLAAECHAAYGDPESQRRSWRRMRVSDRRQNMICASTTQARATASCGGTTKPARSRDGADPAAPTSSSKPRGAWHAGRYVTHHTDTAVAHNPHRHRTPSHEHTSPAALCGTGS